MKAFFQESIDTVESKQITKTASSAMQKKIDDLKNGQEELRSLFNEIKSKTDDFNAKVREMSQVQRSSSNQSAMAEGVLSFKSENYSSCIKLDEQRLDDLFKRDLKFWQLKQIEQSSQTEIPEDVIEKLLKKCREQIESELSRRKSHKLQDYDQLLSCQSLNAQVIPSQKSLPPNQFGAFGAAKPSIQSSLSSKNLKQVASQSVPGANPFVMTSAAQPANQLSFFVPKPDENSSTPFKANFSNKEGDQWRKRSEDRVSPLKKRLSREVEEQK